MKHRSTKILILLLLIGVILSGYNYFQRPFLQRFLQSEQTTEIKREVEVDPRQLILENLSTKEKIMQTIALPVILGEATPSADAQLAWIETNNPGFITIFGNNLTATEVASFTSQLSKLESQQRPLVAVDHEGGAVQRLRGQGFITLSSWRQSCQMDSDSRIKIFSQSASELNQAGVQIVFAPVVDVARANSFLGNRACTDAEEIVATTKDYVTSFAQYGILSVIKHFPGIGSLTSDPHNQLDSVSLESSDTSVFNQVLKTFPNLGVMTTHVAVENKTSGLPCSLSALCLNSFSSNFPQVPIFTDALEMASAGFSLEGNSEIESPKSLSQRAQEALIAGNDVLVFGETIDMEKMMILVDELVDRYENEESLRDRVDEVVFKILTLKTSAEKL